MLCQLETLVAPPPAALYLTHDSEETWPKDGKPALIEKVTARCHRQPPPLGALLEATIGAVERRSKPRCYREWAILCDIPRAGPYAASLQAARQGGEAYAFSAR